MRLLATTLLAVLLPSGAQASPRFSVDLAETVAAECRVSFAVDKIVRSQGRPNYLKEIEDLGRFDRNAYSEKLSEIIQSYTDNLNSIRDTETSIVVDQLRFRTAWNPIDRALDPVTHEPVVFTCADLNDPGRFHMCGPRDSEVRFISMLPLRFQLNMDSMEAAEILPKFEPSSARRGNRNSRPQPEFPVSMSAKLSWCSDNPTEGRRQLIGQACELIEDINDRAWCKRNEDPPRAIALLENDSVVLLADSSLAGADSTPKGRMIDGARIRLVIDLPFTNPTRGDSFDYSSQRNSERARREFDRPGYRRNPSDDAPHILFWQVERFTVHNPDGSTFIDVPIRRHGHRYIQ